MPHDVVLSFVHFAVPCIPVPKSRPRYTRAGWLYTPKSTKDFEELVAQYAAPHFRDGGPWQSGQSVSVALVFAMPVPASWTQKKRKAALLGDIRPTAKPDIDNLVKSVLDGLTGVAYADDAQIAEIIASKTYSAAPGVDVYLSRGPFSETEKQMLIRTKEELL